MAGRIGGATANGKGQYLTAIKGAAPSRMAGPIMTVEIGMGEGILIITFVVIVIGAPIERINMRENKTV